MRWFHAIALLLTFSLVAQASSAADPSPLIANGDLEADRNSDGWPDGWVRSKDGIAWEAEEGNHFLRLRSAKPGETVMLYQPVKLPEGTMALTLGFRMRCTDLKPGKQPWFDARVLLEFKDASGEKLSGGPPAPYLRKSSNGWLERRISFLVPDGAVTLEFMPALLQVEQGTFDLDDVLLTAADAAPLREAAKAAAAAAQEKREKAAAARRAKAAAVLEKEGSLLTNGDFERDAKGDEWPDDWSRLKLGGEWLAEDGNHFLRLSSSEPGQMVVLYRPIDIPLGVEALELSWRQRISNLKPGQEPWFDARIMLEFKDDAGKKLSGKPSPPYSRNNTPGWVERRVQFLVPPEALTLEFMPSLFQVRAGTYDLDDFVLKPTDPAPLVAAAQAAEAARRAAYVPAETPRREKWPPELHVEGNQVRDQQGRTVWLQGVNVVSLEFSLQGEQVQKSALVAVDNWKANCVRLPVKESYWFGQAAGQKDGGKAYRALVDEVITLVANRGAYVVLDLHRFRAPTDEHRRFWQDAAAKYKNHPAVLFDLFNEPHGISWDVWRNGGFVAEKRDPADEDAFLTPEDKAKARVGFQSPGMQQLLETVRETGARNIVIAGGLDWAYDLSGIADGFALTERGGNGIVYSTHIYPWKRDWQAKVLRVADQHPIFVGELGADTKKMSFIPAEAQEDPYTWVPDMLGLIQKHKLHWTAFSFHPKASPVMLTGWDYTPTPFWGQFVKDALSGQRFEVKRLR